jgi:hypothetical protein
MGVNMCVQLRLWYPGRPITACYFGLGHNILWQWPLSLVFIEAWLSVLLSLDFTHIGWHSVLGLNSTSTVVHCAVISEDASLHNTNKTMTNWVRVR